MGRKEGAYKRQPLNLAVGRRKDTQVHRIYPLPSINVWEDGASDFILRLMTVKDPHHNEILMQSMKNS